MKYYEQNNLIQHKNINERAKPPPPPPTPENVGKQFLI
jgi:hypothetical protein